MVDEQKMEAQLILHEGLRLRVYIDTEGNFTLGVGYNLTARGPQFFESVIGRRLALTDGATCVEIITRDEALAVLRADIQRVQTAVRTHFPEFDTLNEVRQRVVVDMTFNIGTGVLQFKRAIAAVKRRDWTAASRELYKSKWAYQVDDGPGGKFGRADRLAKMLLTGNDYQA